MVRLDVLEERVQKLVNNSVKKVRGLTVDAEDHVSGGVGSGYVRVRGDIIEQPQGFVISFVGYLGLGCSDGTNSYNNGDVDGDRIVEESTNDLLNKVYGIWRKRGGVVDIVHKMDFGAIGGLCPGMGGMLSEFGMGIL